MLGNILAEVPRRSLSGFYLGTFLTANLATVHFLMNRSSVSCVAGFSNRIEWLERSTVDLYFWMSHFGRNRSGGELARIHRTAQNMAPVGGLCDKLGLNIFVRQRGPGGGVAAFVDHQLRRALDCGFAP